MLANTNYTFRLAAHNAMGPGTNAVIRAQTMPVDRGEWVHEGFGFCLLLILHQLMKSCCKCLVSVMYSRTSTTSETELAPYISKFAIAAKHCFKHHHCGK